jgi:hypothetical protein
METLSARKPINKNVQKITCRKVWLGLTKDFTGVDNQRHNFEGDGNF